MDDDLIRAALDFVLAHEAWEAGLILRGDWTGEDGLPIIRFGDEAYDGMMALQYKRNQLNRRLQAVVK
jgi:hypothetical protein